MLDGFWIVRAEGPQGSAGGVAFFVNGKVFGGDSGFYYMGTYQEKDGVVKARVAVHNFDPAIGNILGVPNDYELHVTGMAKDNEISGTAMVPGIPNENMAICLTKQADL